MAEQSIGMDFPNQLYGWVKENDGTWSLYAPDGTLVIASRDGRAQVSEPTSDFDVANKKYGDDHWGGGGSQPVTVVRVPFTFDTADILTGLAVFTPSAGDQIVPVISTLSVSTAWDGDNPSLEVQSQGDEVGTLATLALSGVNAPTGTFLTTPFQLGSDVAWICTDATPLTILVDNGGGSDAGSTVGEGSITLLVIPAAA